MSNFALKKVRVSNETDLSHFLMVFDCFDLLTKRETTDGQGKRQYIGYALPGTSEDSPAWAISKTIKENNVIKTLWADGDNEFDNVWSQRDELIFK